MDERYNGAALRNVKRIRDSTHSRYEILQTKFGGNRVEVAAR
jgi:hypothetical protein